MPSWLVELLEPSVLYPVAFMFFLFVLGTIALIKLYPFILKFVNLIHDLVGDDKTPGIGRRMDAQGEQLKAIMHEVLPNHGSSLNDSVRRTERALEDHLKVAEKQDQEQKATAKRLEGHIKETKEYVPLIKDLHTHYIEQGKKEK